MPMQRDDMGRPILPNPIPQDSRQLLALMGESLDYAGQGVVGSIAHEHGTRLYDRFKAHLDLHIAQETATAHEGLTSATRALKTATWVLAAITILLALVEGFKMWRGH
jgi:hypothetical protein